MKDDSAVNYFRDTILAWFKDHAREFKWRAENLSAYEIIIAEVLLQRTKAETVAKFYENFICTYPGWDALASADQADIENFLIPVGLYRQRASRLKKLADYMVSTGGNLPLQRAELENVPFMGQYIANAVELQVRNINRPLLDVNMARVLERYFGPRKLSDIRYDPYLQELAHRVVDHPQAKLVNWAILDFAAIVCKARKPACMDCPLQDSCRYFNYGATYM